LKKTIIYLKKSRDEMFHLDQFFQR
jgi:hypothetical protein